MKVPVYNKKGEAVSELELPKEIFEVAPNADLVHQVVVAQAANRRQTIAHTKTRGEVRGGGKKPWRQKGTGRARHGSIRSPLWKGGGVTFGPRKERTYEQEINRKMRKKALLVVLSEKARNNNLLVIDDLNIEKPKTKIMSEILQSLPSKSKSTLIALPAMEKNTILASRNIPFAKTVQAKDLNALDAASSMYMVMPRESVGVLETILLDKTPEIQKESAAPKVKKPRAKRAPAKKSVKKTKKTK